EHPLDDVAEVVPPLGELGDLGEHARPRVVEELRRGRPHRTHPSGTSSYGSSLGARACAPGAVRAPTGPVSRARPRVAPSSPTVVLVIELGVGTFGDVTVDEIGRASRRRG